MSAPAPEKSDKIRQFLFFFVFIALAVWGGWGLARMGQDRADKKAFAEGSLTAGSGEVRPVAVAPAPVEKVAVIETAPAVVVPGRGVERHPVVIDPAVATGDKQPECEVVLDTPAVEEATPVKTGPAVLRLKVVPGAEILVADGSTRALGTADLDGNFTVDTLSPGEHRVEVRHRDYLPAGLVTVKLKAGETVTESPALVARPGSLTVLTDEGSTVYCEGRKYGAGTTMLGNLPAGRELSLRIVASGGAEFKENLTLAPRENRVLDRRLKPVEVPKAPEPGVSGEKPFPNNNPASQPQPSPASPPKAVLLASISRADGLLVLAATGSLKSPLKTGETAVLKLGAESIPVTCVSLSGGLAVCRYSAGETSATVREGAKGLLEFPAR